MKAPGEPPPFHGERRSKSLGSLSRGIEVLVEEMPISLRLSRVAMGVVKHSQTLFH
jgi:hypothetical protein